MTTALTRVSSTSLSTFLDCPRKFYYGIKGDPKCGKCRKMEAPCDYHVLSSSYAMDVGTLTHACIEWYGQTGTVPSRGAIRTMDGAYERPGEALKRHPGAWDEAFNDLFPLAKELFPMEGEPEVSIDGWIDDYRGVTFGGTIDWFDRDARLIRDWKSRGSMYYAPKTVEDFYNNLQLVYYAAVTAWANGWDWVEVEHGNLIRRTKKTAARLDRRRFRLEAAYLESCFQGIKGLVDQMIEVLEAEEDHVRREPGNCWKYGPCFAMKFCVPENPEGKNFFELFSDAVEEEDEMIRSPQAPEDIKPVPFEERPVKDLGFNTNVVDNLHDLGLYTLLDLDKWLAKDNKLTDISGVGPKTKDSALEMLEAYRG